MAEPLPVRADARPMLSVEHVAKRFGALQAVSDLTLSLQAGEILGFVGPNGAGKTTALRILGGLIKADAGVGQVMGYDLMASPRAIAARVGYMPQRLALYGDLTAAENLRFRAEVYGHARPAAAVEAAISDFDLGPFRKVQARRLSGGWARRLQLAAALIHRPSLALLDEPTAGLDADSRQDVWRRIHALAHAGGAVLVNTHDLAEAERCSIVALFSAGRVVALGDPERLTSDAPFAVMLGGGVDIGVLFERFKRHAGVIAAYPEGHRLRLLIRPGARADVRAALVAVGATAQDAQKRLEDAAFVLVQDKEASTWAAG